MRFVSLKTKLGLPVILLAVCAAGLPGSYLVWRSYGALREQAQQSQLALARSLAAQVDQSISQVISAVDVLAKRPDVVSMKRDSLIRELSLVATTSDLLDALVVVKTDGKVQARALSGLRPQDMPSRWSYLSYLGDIRKNQGSMVTGLYKTRSGDLALAVNAPIQFRAKTVGMLMGLHLLSNHNIGSLEDIKVGKGGSAFLVDENGRSILHPKKSTLQAELSASPEVAALLKEDEGITEFIAQDNLPYLAAFAKIESVSWGVVVRQSAAECYAPAGRMLHVFSLFLVTAILASAVLAFGLAGRVVGPLISVASEVRRFESGRLDSRALEKFPANDEVGQVAQALAAMARALKAQQLERERAHQRALAAEKRLAESERLSTLGQLSAGLAHELNNPLAVIEGSAREAARGLKNPEAAAWLTRIEQEAQRCLRLVRDLLGFARPQKLRRRRFHPAEALRGAFDLARHGRQEIYELKCQCPQTNLWADPDKFKQVMINLFANAMDAMPQGGDIDVAISEAPGRLTLRVRDHGAGLPKGKPDMIFRPFFTTKRQGTGLGLAIARSIMLAHGGSIQAERPRGRGSLFVTKWPK